MGVSFAPSAMPSRGEGSDIAYGNKREKEMTQDHAAYKRMKAEGLQPKSVRGVADVERHAEDSREITEGKLMTKKKLEERKIVHEAMGEAGMLK
jgi:hypothetical protein